MEKSRLEVGEIRDYLSAGFSGILVKTTEAKRADRVVKSLVNGFQRKDGIKYSVQSWDMATAKSKNPVDPIIQLRSPNTANGTVIILHNYHWFLNPQGHQVIQEIQNSMELLRGHVKAIVILSPTGEIPIEVRKDFAVMSLPLPKQDDIEPLVTSMAKKIASKRKGAIDVPKGEELIQIIESCKGLAETEIENALALSLVKSDGFNVDIINEQKIQIIEKSGFLNVMRTKKTYNDIRGYEKAKMVVSKMIKNPKSRGVLFTGPPGCLSGDTTIRVNRAKRGFSIDLKTLYERTNKIKYSYDDSIPTKVRSYDGNSIQLQESIGVIYSGKKDIMQLTLKNGSGIKATPDHGIMTEHGWVEMGKLIPGGMVMCDALSPVRGYSGKPPITEEYQTFWNAWFHPAAKTKKTRDGRGYTKTILKHRSVYEASMNNITLEEFLDVVRKDEKKARKLKYLKSKEVIHHIDGDIRNNSLRNLERTTDSDHKRLHCLEAAKSNFGQGIPTFSEVLDIRYSGFVDTFDIQCPTHHNFVANNIIVHNCGKTLFAECTVGEFKKIALILNFGLLFSKWQGEGDRNVEEAIKIIEAIGNCVVVMDEFEKQFAGAGGSAETDSGVTKRLTGRWLRFMSDEKPDGVYFMGTCNSFKGIPDEYFRVKRWDSSPFFIDIPTDEEKMDILNFHASRLGVEFIQDDIPDMKDWTGAEIEGCCEMARNMEITLKDASAFIVPQNRGGFREADELRPRCVSASNSIPISEYAGRRIDA